MDRRDSLDPSSPPKADAPATRPKRATLLPSFAYWLVFLATLAGFYVGADAVHLRWLFFVVVGTAALFAVGPRTFRFAAMVYDRFSAYPSLVRRVAELATQVDDLESDRASLEKQVEMSFGDGLEEGKRDVIGANLAEQLTAMPEIVALVEGDDQTLLVARAPEGCSLNRGTRFDVVVAETGVLRGTVEVLSVDDDSRTAHLFCVVPIAPKFWAAIDERVAIDAAPPSDVKLVPHRISLPEMEALSDDEAVAADQETQ